MLIPISNSNRPLVRFWLCMGSGHNPWMTASPARSPPIQPTLTSLRAVTQIAPNLQLPVCLTDSDGNGYISCNELNDLFKAACLPLPGYRVREIIENLMATGDLDQDGKISFDEFIKVSMTQNPRRCIWNVGVQFGKRPERHPYPPCFNIAYSLLYGFLNHRWGF